MVPDFDLADTFLVSSKSTPLISLLGLFFSGPKTLNHHDVSIYILGGSVRTMSKGKSVSSNMYWTNMNKFTGLNISKLKV